MKQWLKNESELLKIGDVRKRQRRSGSGKGAQFPGVEEDVMAWFKDQQDRKLTVNYEAFRREAKKVAARRVCPDFKGSNHWIRGVCRRNKVTSRKVTHVSQQDNSSISDKHWTILKHFQLLRQKCAGLAPQFIFNMDETPSYFDMASSSTLHFKGEKTVDGLDTGHAKTRFTAVLCVSANGHMIHTLIILKGLKKIPKVKLPAKIDLAVSGGGSMTTGLMLQWVKNCF